MKCLEYPIRNDIVATFPLIKRDKLIRPFFDGQNVLIKAVGIAFGIFEIVPQILNGPSFDYSKRFEIHAA